MDVASGCGCKEVYRFHILLIPTPLVSARFNVYIYISLILTLHSLASESLSQVLFLDFGWSGDVLHHLLSLFDFFRGCWSGFFGD